MPRKKKIKEPVTPEEIRQLMDKAERRTTLNWVFSIGFGFLGVGIGRLPPGSGYITGGLIIGAGVLLMGGVYWFSRNNGK